MTERSAHQERISAAMKLHWKKRKAMIPIRLEKPKARKYRNVPQIVDGIRFASKREAHRYCELKELEKRGDIEGLKLQPRYPFTINGMHVCTYVADFAYFDHITGRSVIEDSKGVKTPEFIIKAKLFHALYGREIVLV